MKALKEYWQNHILVRYSALFLVLGLAILIGGNALFFRLTKDSRLELKRQADVLVLRLIDTENPVSDLEKIVQARSQLQVLDSDYWLLDQDKKVLSSSSGLSLPAINESFIWPNEAEKFNYFVVSNSAKRQLIGVGRLSSQPMYLVTAQKTRETFLAKLQSQFFYNNLIFFSLALLVGIFVAVFSLRALVRLLRQVQMQDVVRLRMIQEVCHDLGSPLSAIKSSIENLLEHFGKLDISTQKKLLMGSHTEIQYMQDLTDNLLFIAEMNSKKYRASNEQVAIQKILDQEVDLLEKDDKVIKSSIKINKTYSSSQEALINGDGFLLRRALRNLLVNAAKFAKTEIQVRLSTDRSRVLIEIEDDGVGFSSDLKDSFDKLFTDYKNNHQFKQPLKGLGLMISAQVAKLHHGSLQLENRSRRGALCKLVLAKE